MNNLIFMSNPTSSLVLSLLTVPKSTRENALSEVTSWSCKQNPNVAVPACSAIA
ncbi:hypothetical protein BDQ12DRAFT_684212 [Crucibulum laeve]|uniref:Uncharacterized protein n=1 Tax=Crucibulum laeve TaxID=68775 RepID=A0A5C3M262_9AGAR|nr:hypothetical protein BDQ12DRAFT_684212 [Crucibulum laeve]